MIAINLLSINNAEMSRGISFHGSYFHTVSRAVVDFARSCSNEWACISWFKQHFLNHLLTNMIITAVHVRQPHVTREQGTSRRANLNCCHWKTCFFFIFTLSKNAVWIFVFLCTCPHYSRDCGVGRVTRFKIQFLSTCEVKAYVVHTCLLPKRIFFHHE